MTALVVAGVLALGAAPASATFHLMQIREVYAGSAAAPEAEYVELQMWASGQNLVEGHVLRSYDTTGKVTATSSFSHDVSGEANQSTLLLASPQAEAQFGVAADAPLAAKSLSSAGGAVCWETIDCVAWGNFSGTLPSPAGSPVAPGGIPTGWRCAARSPAAARPCSIPSTTTTTAPPTSPLSFHCRGRTRRRRPSGLVPLAARAARPAVAAPDPKAQGP